MTNFGNPMPLKYLFKVEYLDGTIYEQNPEDISISDTKRSCFYDVKQEEVKKFYLIGNGNTFCIDLTDGHFEVNKVHFKFHEEELKDFRLIFWRRHTHTLNAMNMNQLTHEVVYRFGWQTTLDGENIQRVMEID